MKRRNAERIIMSKLNATSFEAQVSYFNHLYSLPVAPYPTLRCEITFQEKMNGIDSKLIAKGAIHRLRSFKTIIMKEIAEVDDIITNLFKLQAAEDFGYTVDDEAIVNVLTDLADWLGDITVYCASEAQRFGIPLDAVLPIIMQSNFSKLGADGLPIYDADGKVDKGPDYWKPEAKIKALLQTRINEYFESEWKEHK